MGEGYVGQKRSVPEDGPSSTESITRYRRLDLLVDLGNSQFLFTTKNLCHWQHDSLSQLVSMALLFNVLHHLLCSVRHSIFNDSVSFFPICLQLDFHFIMPGRVVRVLEEHMACFCISRMIMILLWHMFSHSVALAKRFSLCYWIHCYTFCVIY